MIPLYLYRTLYLVVKKTLGGQSERSLENLRPLRLQEGQESA
jgi:hypothetical protein